MISKNIAKQILRQVHEEFANERIYIAMEMYFRRLDLNGYADLFHDYALEEREHGYDMLAFLDDWGCDTTIRLDAKDIPNNFTSPMNVFEVAYAQEKITTKCISDIYKNAIKEGDIISQDFLDKYLEEQREEEDKMHTRLMRLKLAGDNTSAILFLDSTKGI